jgi:Ca-activated chloride channel family protein
MEPSWSRWLSVAVAFAALSAGACEKKEAPAAGQPQSRENEPDEKTAATALATAAPQEGRGGVAGQKRRPAEASAANGPGKDKGEAAKPGDHPGSPPAPPAAKAGGVGDGSIAPGPAPGALIPIDPNGRFATTYRPGGGHLAAFESAVARGIIPAAEREVVSDVGARYITPFDVPKGKAMGIRTDFERAKLAPGGGPVHVRVALRSTADKASARPHLSVHPCST